MYSEAVLVGRLVIGSFNLNLLTFSGVGLLLSVD